MSEQFSWLAPVLAVPWVGDVVAAVAALVVALFFLNGFLSFLSKQASKSSNMLDDVLIAALGAPARLMIWLVVLGFLARPMLALAGFDVYLGMAWKLAVLVVLAWFVLRLLQGYLNAFMARAEASPTPVDTDMYAMGVRVLKLSTIVLAGLALMHTLGISIAGILTFGGVGGLIVGLAAKDFLENFFGALMIHLDRPFRTGDWIRIREKDIEGLVEEIRWRQTRIRTFSRNLLFVPNSVFLSAVIENPSQMTHRKINEVIGLRYDDFDKMPAIIKDVEQLLIDHVEIDDDMPQLVRFETFGPSSVDFLVQCYSRRIERAEFTAIRQALLFDVAQVIARHGAEIAFPTQTVYLEKEAD